MLCSRSSLPHFNVAKTTVFSRNPQSFPTINIDTWEGGFGVTIFLVGIAGMACVLARMTHWLTIWADPIEHIIYFFSILPTIKKITLNENRSFHMSLSFNICQHQNTVVINGTFLLTL